MIQRNIFDMKKIVKGIIFFISSLIIISCSSESSDERTINEWECGTYNGHTLFTGSKGGCYYKNSNGNKTYVDRSKCNC